MSSRIPKDASLAEVDRLLSFWENRLGATFEVGETDLTGGKALRTTLATNLTEEQTAEDILAGKQVATNGTIGLLEKLWVNLRREVAVAHGTDSAVYGDIPSLSHVSARETTTETKPSD
jgi:hypothetical protein